MMGRRSDACWTIFSEMQRRWCPVSSTLVILSKKRMGTKSPEMGISGTRAESERGTESYMSPLAGPPICALINAKTSNAQSRQWQRSTNRMSLLSSRTQQQNNRFGRVSFRASFATFSELINDEKTRTFLTLEVGAGHNEVSTPLLAEQRDRLISCLTYHPSLHSSELSQKQSLLPSALSVKRNSTLTRDSTHQLHGPFWKHIMHQQSVVPVHRLLARQPSSHCKPSRRSRNSLPHSYLP